jgi:hypothetical protein
MSTINTYATLQSAILELELQQAHELGLLKEEFNAISESLRPLNIIKSTLKNAITAPDLKLDMVNAVIGLTTGVLAKKLMIGKTINPFKKLLGIIVEMTVANKVAANATEIRSTGHILFDKLFSKKEKSAKL